LADAAVDAFVRGKEAFARRDFVRAEAEFSDSFNQLQHPLTAYFLSLSYFKAGDYKNAKKWANTALTPTPGYTLDTRYVAGSHDIVQFSDAILSPHPAPTSSADGIGISASADTAVPAVPVPSEVPARGEGKLAMIAAARSPAVTGTIQAESATYGANCGAPHGNVTNHIAGECNGKSNCTYTVDYTVIGDPAPGCVKDFDVRYTCAGSQTQKAMQISGEEAGVGGKTLTLTCP
jgi:hypothetical protein